MVTDLDGMCEIRVIDQGIGVPAEFRERIFVKFEQVSAAESRRGGRGTGLGLAIAKEIVLGHKDSIGVDGEAAGGSEFWMRLPKLVTIKCQPDTAPVTEPAPGTQQAI